MTDTKPTILVFCRGEIEGGLKKIKEKASVYQASYLKRNAPVKLLSEHLSAQAIWIVDPDIATPKYKDLSRKVVNYARNGGIVILGGFFSTLVTPPDFDKWMKDVWDLPWRYGQYETTTVVFQSSAVGPRKFWQDGLVAAYTQKGVFLENVSPADSWYASPPGSTSESRVFGPVPIQAQTSIAFGRVGGGWLGWTGDIRNTEETAAAVQAMMGLNAMVSSYPAARLAATGPRSHRNANVQLGEGTQSHLPEAASHPRDSLPTWKWRTLLVANGFLTVMHGYDVSNVANIQAPIYKAFGHIELLSWVALSYSVCNIALIPLGRKLFKFGDFKTLCLASMMFIIGGSALSGAAPNIECIIAGRAVMALGSSIIYQGILSFNIIFTYPHELGLVQSSIGACFALGLVLGPVIGGAFANNNHTTWRWAFYLVIPLCVISLVLQALFYPRYSMPTTRTTWTHIKEVDWIGSLLHIGTCLLFAISYTSIGSTATWGINSGIATWTLFTFFVVIYVLQQAYNLGTTPENRLLSPSSLLHNRTILLTWICTFCTAASYGVTLYYVPIYFAFGHGLDPLAAATRLLPFIGVFIFIIMLCGRLLPTLQFYKAFFVVGSFLLLLGGGLFQMLSTDMSESAVMGLESVVAAGLGIIWQLGVPVCTTFLSSTEDRLDLALLSNMAQLGGIAASLSIAGMVYQSMGFQSLKDSVGGMGFSDESIRELLSGVDSPILKDADPKVLRLAVKAIVDAIRACFIILLAAGCMSFLAAWSMSWEAVEFNEPTRQRHIWQSGNIQLRHQRSDGEFLLDDLNTRGGTVGGALSSPAATHICDKR
ncbi:major facilitator superfamily domain-containing protein [Daldinia grandis]|nr:major facilitator superfamily domain-containing protein [Daldinia grandis]